MTISRLISLCDPRTRRHFRDCKKKNVSRENDPASRVGFAIKIFCASLTRGNNSTDVLFTCIKGKNRCLLATLYRNQCANDYVLHFVGFLLIQRRFLDNPRDPVKIPTRFKSEHGEMKERVFFLHQNTEKEEPHVKVEHNYGMSSQPRTTTVA